MRNRQLITVLVTSFSFALVSGARSDDVFGADSSGQASRNGSDLPPDLFEPTAAPGLGGQLRQHVVQSLPVLVRMDELGAAMTGDKFSLNPMPPIRYIGVVERVDRRSESRFTVAGRLAETPRGTFIIVVEGKTAIGLIQDPTGERRFKLGYLSDGIHVINEIDSESFGRCGNEELASDPLPGTLVRRTPAAEESLPDPPAGGLSTGACAPLLPVFDMMIVYTAAARLAIGGTDAMNAECQLALEVANGAYVNSGIDARMRLVYRGEISYDESGTLNDHLSLLAGTGDGFMDEVHALRNTYGADIVTLFVDDADGWCGLGACVPSTAARAFNVVQWACASSGFSYAHEVGHNQGCAHDRDNAGGGCAAYPSSYGWRFTGNSFSIYRTVMAYSPGTRIQYFSNPDVEFDGTPTGVPLGDPDQANNALTINSRTFIENHRPSRFDVWVDPAYAGAQTGAFDQPYDTVAAGAANVSNGVGASEQPTLWIKAGSSNETVTISTPMFVRSCGGLVTIGN